MRRIHAAPPPHAALAIVVSLAAAALVAACGDAGPTAAPPTGAPSTAAGAASTAPTAAPTAPTAAPTASPALSASPAPSASSTAPPPSPAEVVAAFRTFLADPALSARLVTTAETTVGRHRTRSVVTLEADGVRRHLALTTGPGSAPASTVETLSADGHRFLYLGGVWIENGTPTGDDLLALLRGATAVSDTGTETGADGETLHRLRLTEPAAFPAELRPEGDLNRLAVRVAVLVDDRGEPVRASLEATWRVLKGTHRLRATMMADVGFLDVGQVAIDAPTDLWRFATSTRFAYHLAAPASWRSEPGTKQYVDTWYGPDRSAVYAGSGPSFGLTLNRLSGDLRTYLPRIKGVPRLTIDASRPALLGPLRARLVEFHYRYQKRDAWAVGYIAVDGGRVYLVSVETATPTTDADRAFAARVAGTFSPT